MKKKYLLLLFACLLLFSSVQACAICGCGAGNYYLGIMPPFGKNFAGVRYRSYGFRSHLGQGFKPFEATHETFQSIELWGRFYLTPRLQVIALIDYNFNTQLDQDVTKKLQGLGDIPIIVNYNVLNTTTDAMSSERTLNHVLWLGGGLKLPTGQYKYNEDATAVANANFQLGTGSIDYLMNGLYTLRYKKWGLSVDANCKINSQNSDEYKFGDRFSATAAAFFVKQIGALTVMPNAGVYTEHSRKNQQYGIAIDETGGAATFASLGVEANYKKISMGFNYQSPFAQHLADGHSKAEDKLMMHVTMLF